MIPTHIIKSDNQQIGDLEVSYPAYAEQTCLLKQDDEIIELTENMVSKIISIFRVTKVIKETNRCKQLYTLVESDMMQPGPINDEIA